MKKNYSTPEAAKRIGVSFPTLHRWLKAGQIRPQGFPVAGRTVWVWTDEDIEKGRRLKGTLRPGPKPRKGRKA